MAKAAFGSRPEVPLSSQVCLCTDTYHLERVLLVPIYMIRVYGTALSANVSIVYSPLLIPPNIITTPDMSGEALLELFYGMRDSFQVMSAPLCSPGETLASSRFKARSQMPSAAAISPRVMAIARRRASPASGTVRSARRRQVFFFSWLQGPCQSVFSKSIV